MITPAPQTLIGFIKKGLDSGPYKHNYLNIVYSLTLFVQYLTFAEFLGCTSKQNIQIVLKEN